MRENDNRGTGTGDSEDTSSSSFMVIGGDGGVDDGDDDDRGRQHFVRTLGSKLKKLQRHTTNGGKQISSSSSKKPIFVTTVKTGIFLDPPPDLAALLGLDDRSSTGKSIDTESNRYYSYSSKPRVLYDRHHQRTTASIRKTDRQPDICKQMGYTNIMHDKRVVRGSNFAKKSSRPKWNPYFGYAKQLSSELVKESPAAREAEARRRAMARKKAMDYQTRALRLHLQGARKVEMGRQNVGIETNLQLEELFEYPPSQSFGAQTEFDQEMFLNSGTGMPAVTDASTQVDDKDLFDFDSEVTPIAETLIADVFRQAMREVLYEDELDARARQQRALYLRHTIEEIEKQRLEHEDERLNQVATNHAQLFDKGETYVKARTFELTPGRVTDLLPEVLNDLNQNEYTTNSTAERLEFVSWLMEELQADKSKHIDSDEILKSIIHDLIKRRLDTYNEVIDVQNIQKPEELFEEVESITLYSDQINNEDSWTSNR